MSLVLQQPEIALKKLSTYESSNTKLMLVKNYLLSCHISKYTKDISIVARKKLTSTYNMNINLFIHLIPELLYKDSNSGLLIDKEKVIKIREPKVKLDAIQGPIKPRDLENEKLIRSAEYRKTYSMSENRDVIDNPQICYLRFSRSKVAVFDSPNDLKDAMQSFITSNSSYKEVFIKKLEWGSVKTPDGKFYILDIKLENVVIGKSKLKIESNNSMIVNAFLRHEYYGPLKNPNIILSLDNLEKFKYLIQYQNLILNRFRILFNQDPESLYAGFICNNPVCSHSKSFFVKKSFQKNNRVFCFGLIDNISHCANEFCYKCGKPYHGEHSLCSSSDDEKSEQEIVAITKKCPNPECTYKISKDGGCTHMSCSKCNLHFCWTCLQTFPATEGWHAPNTSSCQLND